MGIQQTLESAKFKQDSALIKKIAGWAIFVWHQIRYLANKRQPK
jgi:hypothetical protein